MQHWRYHSLMLRDLSICESKLNAEGEKGWELVSMCRVDANTARAFFKQPIEETDSAVVAVPVEAGAFSRNPFE